MDLQPKAGQATTDMGRTEPPTWPSPYSSQRYWMMASDSSICLSPLLGSIMKGNWLLPLIWTACTGRAARTRAQLEGSPLHLSRTTPQNKSRPVHLGLSHKGAGSLSQPSVTRCAKSYMQDKNRPWAGSWARPWGRGRRGCPHPGLTQPPGPAAGSKQSEALQIAVGSSWHHKIFFCEQGTQIMVVCPLVCPLPLRHMQFCVIGLEVALFKVCRTLGALAAKW